jgi:ribonuclease P protein component
MLPKENRLNIRTNFTQIKNLGKKVHDDALLVYFLKSNSESPSKFGISISKKVSKSAVVRNRLRRKVHRALHKYKSAIITGVDSIIIILKNFSEENNEDTESRINNLVKKAGLLNEKDSD